MIKTTVPCSIIVKYIELAAVARAEGPGCKVVAHSLDRRAAAIVAVLYCTQVLVSTQCRIVIISTH